MSEIKYLESSFGEADPILKCPALKLSELPDETPAPGMLIAALTADDLMGDDDAARPKPLSGLPPH